MSKSVQQPHRALSPKTQKRSLNRPMGGGSVINTHSARRVGPAPGVGERSALGHCLRVVAHGEHSAQAPHLATLSHVTSLVSSRCGIMSCQLISVIMPWW